MASKHLKWFEIKDFTPGLWEKGVGTPAKIAAPPNSFSELTNYRPMKAGGLRAFVKGSTVFAGTSTALTNGMDSGASIAGLFIQGGVDTRPGKSGGSLLTGVAAVDSQILYVVTINRTDFKARLLRLDISNDESTWTAKYTDVTGHSTANHAPATFDLFQLTNGDIYVVWTVHGGGNRGLFKIGYAPGASGTGIDGDVDKIISKNGPVIVHQARVLVAGVTGSEPDTGQEGASIFYSDGPGDITFDDGNFIKVDPNHASGGSIALMSHIEPADLIVGKDGSPWSVLSGDIASSQLAVRQMGNEHHPRQSMQQVVQVPGGIAFIEPNGQIFVTDGRNFQSISDQLDLFPVKTSGRVGPGKMEYANGLLWAPRGFVYDFETKSWFRQTALPHGMQWSYDAHYGEMVGAAMNITETAWNGVASTLANSMAVFPVFPTTTAQLNPTASFTTQPFYDTNGRNVAVREVQVFHTPHRTGGTITVSLFNRAGSLIGSANTKTTGTAEQPDMTAFLFPGLKDRAVSVKVACDSGGAAGAHTIEGVRFGFDGNNSLSLTAA